MPFDKTPKTDTAVAHLRYAFGDTRCTEFVADQSMQQWLAEQRAAPKRRKFKPEPLWATWTGLSGVRQSQRQNGSPENRLLAKPPYGKPISQPTAKLDLQQFKPGERVKIDEWEIDLSHLIGALELQFLERRPSAPVQGGTIQRCFRDVCARLDLAHFRA